VGDRDRSLSPTLTSPCTAGRRTRVRGVVRASYAILRYTHIVLPRCGVVRVSYHACPDSPLCSYFSRSVRTPINVVSSMCVSSCKSMIMCVYRSMIMYVSRLVSTSEVCMCPPEAGKGFTGVYVSPGMIHEK
jgi:hypothetical protein